MRKIEVSSRIDKKNFVATLHLSAADIGSAVYQRVTIAESSLNSPQLSANSPQLFSPLIHEKTVQKLTEKQKYLTGKRLKKCIF